MKAGTMLSIVPISGRGENSPALQPELLPDELISGLIVRTARVRGVARQRIEQEMTSATKVDSSKVPILLGGLAKALRVDAGDLIARHSLIPFWKAFARERVPFRDQISWLSNTSPPVREIRYCKACLEQDLQQYGFSYWRRTHQIPGVVLCPVHGEVLYVAIDVREFNKLPQDIVDRSELAITRPNAAKLKMVRAYCEIANHLIHRSEPTDSTVMKAAIRTRAGELGLRAKCLNKRVAQGRSIADLANDLAPRDWLRRHFETGKGGAANSHSFGLTTVCQLEQKRIGSASNTYVLALALLYANSKQAIAALSEWNLSDCGQDKVVGPNTQDSTERIFNVLARHAGCVSDAATNLGMGDDALRTRLAKLGLISLERILDTPTELALADFFDGASLRRVTSQYGVSEAQLESLLRRASALFSHLLRRVREKRGQTQSDRIRNAA